MKRIFIHGLGQTPSGWDKVLDNLSSARECICPDLPKLLSGGEADYGRLYTAFENICEQADSTLDLCGLSLGGVLALNYAIEHPQRVHSLVLIAPQYKMPKALLRLQNIIFRLMPKSTFNETGFDKRDFMKLCATMADLDFSASLAKVDCPALIICGENDSANKKAAEELSQILKSARFCIIKDAGHEVNLDAPEKLAQVVDEFWGEL